MKISVLLFATLLLSHCLYSQKRQNAIELTPYFRYSNYGTYDDWYGRSFATKLTLKGTSFGLNADYILNVARDWQARIGIGYFKYTFNNLKNVDVRNVGGTSDKRPFEYPHPDAVLFYTDNYSYNTLSINFGWEKVCQLKKGYAFTAGAALQTYYTYSQLFKVTWDNYSDYKRKDAGVFGFSANINFGITKHFQNFYLGPKLFIPLFDQWKKDKIFAEDSGSRSKWFSGIGGGITMGTKF